MKTIRRVVKFEYDGKLYDTKKKAIDANENEINAMIRDLLKEPMTGNYTKDSFSLTSFILDNREKLVDLLYLDFDIDEN